MKYVPGTLLKHKKSGEFAILEHTYNQAFGKGDEGGDLAIIWLDDKENPEFSTAWRKKSEFLVIDSDIKKNLQKIRKYNKGEAAPISMNPELAEKLGYGSIHTYASAKSGSKKGGIKL